MIIYTRRYKRLETLSTTTNLHSKLYCHLAYRHHYVVTLWIVAREGFAFELESITTSLNSVEETIMKTAAIGNSPAPKGSHDTDQVLDISEHCAI